MKITSPEFSDLAYIPSRYTCDGEDVNPPLQFWDVPKGTRSLVLIVDDVDAPHGVWVHWVLSDINIKVTAIAAGSVPHGATEGTTSFGRPGYGGPCPPLGTHRYFFRLYALDTKLNLPASAGKAETVAAMVDHVLAEAELIGLYTRQTRHEYDQSD